MLKIRDLPSKIDGKYDEGKYEPTQRNLLLDLGSEQLRF